MNYLKLAKWKLPLKYFSGSYGKTQKAKMGSKTFEDGFKSISEFLGKGTWPVVGHRSYRGMQIYKWQAKLWTQKFAACLKMDGNFLSMFNYSKRFMTGFVFMCVTNPKDAKIKWQDAIKDIDLRDHLKDLDTIYVMLEKKNAKEIMADDLSWTPFVNSKDLVVWTHACARDKSVIVYKVYGKYSDVSVKDFKKTQLDLKYRKTWDNQVVKLDIVDTDKASGAEVIHWEITWPGMGVYSNRDYCFVRRHFVDKETGDIVIISKTVHHPKVPIDPNVVRVEDYYSIMHIRKAKSGAGLEFGLTYMDNSGVVLPGWVTKWAAGSGLEDFLHKVHVAAKALKKP